MKMAKATEKDIDAAGTALGLLNTISSGYYPGVEDDAPLHFDPEDKAHLSLFYRLMTETLDASPGWQNRVIGGMCYVILFDQNQIIDPASHCLELHPRFAQRDEEASKVALDIARWFINGDRPDEWKLKEWAELLDRDAISKAYDERAKASGGDQKEARNG